MGGGASVRRAGRNSADSDTSRWKDFSQPESQDALGFWSRRYGMTVEEVRVAWNRFRLLNPDEYGCVSRDVFRRPPYSNNMFCKQIWARIPGSEDDQNSIPFEAFLETLKWWQYATVEKKTEGKKALHHLRCKHSAVERVLHARLDMGCPASSPEEVLLVWMCKEGQVKEDLLQKIFRNAKDELSQDEVKKLAQDSMRYMKEGRPPDSTEDPTNVTLEDFKRYIHQFPQSELKTALHFSILDIDTHEPFT